VPEKNKPKDLGLIAARCGAIKHAMDAGGNVEEPYWRAMIGVIKHTTDPDKAAHKFSSGHPQYNKRETQKKLDNWTTNPTTCAEFAKYSTKCATCPSKGKIKSPISLGVDPQPEQLKPNPNDPKAVDEAIAAAGLAFVMDTNGQLNLVTVSGRDGRVVRTCLPAESAAANDAIVSAASATGKMPSERAIETSKAKYRHAARERGEAVPVFLRVAENKNVVYVDHGAGVVARIDSTSCTIVGDVYDGVPLFRRNPGAGGLPTPQLFDCPKEALKYVVVVFSDNFGFTADQSLSVVATLLEWHRPGTPHPIVELVGPAGSGKSSAGDFLRLLIDPPAGKKDRMTVGTDSKDIAAAAQQWHMLQIDNASKLDKRLSDMLCVVSTGGTWVVRLLYANGETAELKLHSPLVISAVSPVCIAPDLQSRVNRIELPRRSGDCIAEDVLHDQWDAIRPKMLGALYTLLSHAIRLLPVVRAQGVWKHRLVDFDQMGEAMAQAGGMNPGEFIAAVGRLRESMARRTASGDLFLIALMAALRNLAERPTHTRQPTLNAVCASMNKLAAVREPGSDAVQIIIRPTALLERVRGSSAANVINNPIPATERGLSDAVRRVQPLLSSLGVQVDERRFGTRCVLQFDFSMEALNDN
jgi:hypothetical protein